MIESTTIGILAVGVLALTAGVAVRGILTDGTRTAYASLKSKVAQWASHDVAVVEKVYRSSPKKARLTEIIERRPPVDRATLRDLTVTLIEALKADACRGSIGVSIRKLDEMLDQLKALHLT